ncbi:MAG: SCO family protein [Fodinibius sp.]|nr:SCO family protein [Fodinibius sp.]
MSDTSYSLLDTDSTAVSFPDDYKGNITVISFIYTHCPDVCPVITANMKNIQSQLDDTTGIRFVEISFDPERDTPSVLANYKSNFKLNEQFSVLTGKPANVDSLLDKMNILAEKVSVDSVQQDSNQYFMKHSNTIYVMDEQGRIKFEHMGSGTPPELVVEDINKLR